METFVIAKVVSIMLLLVAVQAQEFSPSDYSSSEAISLLLESEFPQVFEDTNEPFETQRLALEKESNSKFHLAPQSPAPAPSTPETPLPAKPPSPPKRPWSPAKTCKTKCAANCMRNKVPVLHYLCNKVCRQRCFLHYSQVIYKCTNHCAESMPKNFKSDKKKVAGYVNYCYQKCIKKF